MVVEICPLEVVVKEEKGVTLSSRFDGGSTKQPDNIKIPTFSFECGRQRENRYEKAQRTFSSSE